MVNLTALQKLIRSHSNPQKAAFLARFFRTAPGQYAAHDQLLGITVPIQRKIARDHCDLNLNDLQKLIKSPYHEERLISLLIATHHFEKALKTKDLTSAKEVVSFYLKNTSYINNWDLVDLSAYKILGHWLFSQGQDFKTLIKLAKSTNLWEKRIAIVATYFFTKKGNYAPVLAISTILLQDQHDLIHKAVGWMLRELGKKDRGKLDRFLLLNYQKMPRTTLRYAIEKHSPDIRKKYLLGEME